LVNFRQTDLVRALKSAKLAGVSVARIEIDKEGKIVLVVGTPAEEKVEVAATNPWDRVLK
jgi:hypothetical protein